MIQRSKERVDKYLYRLLASLKEGEKLPSIRSIMTNCQTSQLTVQNILKQYEEKGLIKSKDRSGFYKTQSLESHQDFGELDLIYCTTVLTQDPMMKFHADFSHTLGRLCGASWRSVRMHFLEKEGNTSKITEIAKSSKCHACIVVSSSSLEFSEIFQTYHVNYVNLFPETLQLDQATANIIIDNEDVITRQINYLHELGHQKIAYLYSFEENEIIRDLIQRRETYLKQVIELGLPMKSHWLQYGGYNSETAISGIRNILSQEDQPTALICGDHHLPGVYAGLNEFGLVPGKNFSVIGTDNLPITQILTPMTTSLDIPREKATKKALQALEQRIQGKHYDNMIYIKGTIIERNSIHNPKLVKSTKTA